MKRWIAIIIVGILLIGCGTLVYFKLFNTTTNTKIKAEKPLETIKGFDYKLQKRDKSLYKNEFLNLKKILESKEIDYEKYAESISKLFIIDLYTIDNKVNKYDVGGTEFVYPDVLDNYKLNVEDTIYKYIEDNVNDDRTQNLPIVKSINVTNFKNTTYKLNNEEIDAYEISLKWTYKEDLKYDNKGTLILIKKDKYLYIVEKNDNYEEKTPDENVYEKE